MVLSTKYSLNLMLVVVGRIWSDYGENSNVHIELISCLLVTLSFFSHGNFHRRHPMTKVFFSFLNVSASRDKTIPPVDEEISITEFEIFFSLLLLSPSSVYARDREKMQTNHWRPASLAAEGMQIVNNDEDNDPLIGEISPSPQFSVSFTRKENKSQETLADLFLVV